MLARNSYQYVIALYGSALAGAVAVPLNWNKTWDEIRYELELTDPVCILQDGEYLDREPALAQQFGEKLADIGAFAAFDPALDVAGTARPERSGIYHVHFRHHRPQQGRYDVPGQPVWRHACFFGPL